MNRASPIFAMLWENWRLTRVEAGQRLAAGILLSSIALTFFDSGATIAFWMLVTIHSMIWLSIAKLNGGRFADGYKPGFPFHLWYSKPVPTRTLVSVAILYDAITCTALYLVSAAVVGLVFGQAMPLSSMIVILLSYHFAYACCQWSTRNRLVQWLGSIAFSAPMFFMLFMSVRSPLGVEFSMVQYAVFVAIGVVSYVLTVAGVARQRRGESVSFEPQSRAMSGGFPDWLITPFRFNCPTSSATRAQVWFELKSSGLPVVMLGLAFAVVILLIYAISVPVSPLRPFAIAATVLSVPATLFGLGGNAFGIRRKQGRTYVSAFEMTKPHPTAQAAGIKLIVRTVCLLFAFGAIGVAVWASGPMMKSWETYVVFAENDALPKMLALREKAANAFTGLSGLTYAAMAVVAVVSTGALVAWQASREALRARHPRLLLSVQWAPAAWSVVLLLLALAERKGIVPAGMPRDFFVGTVWASGVAIALAIVYFTWNGFARRVMSYRYAGGALAIAAVFAAALWAGTPVTSVAAIVYMALVILMVGMLPPWALARARHA